MGFKRNLWKKTVRMTETVRNIRLMLLIPNRQNPLAVYSNKRTDRALYMRVLSEFWVFQEKVDMKVSAFSFTTSLLVFGYL